MPMDKEQKELGLEALVLQVQSRCLVMMRGSRVMLKARMRN
jgi:hypothetical protein